ncbi:MAG: hypothetical protein KA766_19755 [Piscinibacter sp.]|uniref:helix-turn-helix transcriptional regulator n=1 Tax=Piscinibacter sp. TaxID=1903157 RepID=UPI0011D68393|nr:hypothetical protein [Piscinibacter sp.]MBP5992240.1 hypothetical protein [Piscinibacter sp.]MBP6028179.1 hypothetical protein [Piscinibacter sp.]TXH59759.1 MAG: hypothetical protein E6Q93_08130 [Burkholderiaceae bacterium]
MKIQAKKLSVASSPVDAAAGEKVTPPAGQTIHPGLVEVALIDAKACAAVGDVSVSWWHAEVRAGRAPAPVIQRPRCTRWRLGDVKAFWAALSTSPESVDAERVVGRARRASAAASAVRAQARVSHSQAA